MLMQQEQFTIHSTSFNPGELVPHHYIFNGMGCKGNNVSPELEWSGEPEGTESFAITVHDPDAPTEHGWWHWSVINIPKHVHKLEEGASNKEHMPKEAIELFTDYGDRHYGGPCPPKGDQPHRYVFTVYALRRKHIDVSNRSKADDVKNKLEEWSLAKASFTAQYGRQ